MKRYRNITLIIFTAGLLAFSAAAQDLSKETFRDLPGTNPHSFVGSWTVQSSVTNCSGVTLQTFAKLTSINDGGTAQETSTGLPPSLRTTAFGIWRHVTRNDFEYALQFFRFNPDGTFAGSTRAKWIAEVDEGGDSYAATAAIQVVSPNGVVVANLCGSETGTRMVIPE